MTEPIGDNGALPLGWSLTTRILAVNIFALAMLAGSFFYLDSYRARIADERVEVSAADTALIANGLAAAPAAARPALAVRLGAAASARVRIYDASGTRVLDSFALAPPTYEVRDPAAEPWQKHVARFMDRSFDRIVDAPRLDAYAEPAVDRLASWPTAVAAQRRGGVPIRMTNAPDRTPMITAATRLADGSGAVLLVTESARDITRIVRAERFSLGMVLAIVVALSVSLSLYLARTIVRPLRKLARAAVRVRVGRAREVVVPRLPSRSDEIGLLARAVSDMSQALRQRIDAIEAFAADVTHELKNPLASLRSAVDSLLRIEDEQLRRQLLDVICGDVIRLDRLITDIAELSRLDAELTRARFDRIDLGPMIEGLLAAREDRGRNGDVRVAFARPYLDSAVIMGDGSRLARMVENLVDNAVSFSPPGGLVEVAASGVGDEVVIVVEDEGPGVPPAEREAIFRRFHSNRPEAEEFGRHSGLGLAIVKAIVEGHDGTVEVGARPGGVRGARFTVHLAVAPRGAASRGA